MENYGSNLYKGLAWLLGIMAFLFMWYFLWEETKVQWSHHLWRSSVWKLYSPFYNWYGSVLYGLERNGYRLKK